MAILNKHATVSVPVVLIIKILPTAKSSFKDPYLNNTVVSQHVKVYHEEESDKIIFNCMYTCFP